MIRAILAISAPCQGTGAILRGRAEGRQLAEFRLSSCQRCGLPHQPVRGPGGCGWRIGTILGAPVFFPCFPFSPPRRGRICPSLSAFFSGLGKTSLPDSFRVQGVANTGAMSSESLSGHDSFYRSLWGSWSRSPGAAAAGNTISGRASGSAFVRFYRTFVNRSLPQLLPATSCESRRRIFRDSGLTRLLCRLRMLAHHLFRAYAED
jgi:hypothetical protein